MTTPPPHDPNPAAVAELAARLDALTDDLDTLRAAYDSHNTDSDSTVLSGPSTRESPTPLYPDLDSWVAGFFTAVYTRPIGGDLRWCPRWYEHPEAAIRLELLWRSWEAYRLRPLGAVEWHRDILDHQLPTLLSDRGPFTACTPDRHEPTTPLPVTPTPPGWWDTGTPAEPAPGPATIEHQPTADPGHPHNPARTTPAARTVEPSPP